MTRNYPILVLLTLAACVSSDDAAITPTPYPFAGTWDCEVATFIFSGDSYNNGSEWLPIANIVERDIGAYVLSFADGYSIALDMDGADRMQWLSGETGDAFACKRI